MHSERHTKMMYSISAHNAVEIDIYIIITMRRNAVHPFYFRIFVFS